MSNVSGAALRLIDKILPYVHKRHYLVCEGPNVEVGNIGIIPKTEIYQYVGLSRSHTRSLLRELYWAGHIALVIVGDHTKVVINPDMYRVSETEPSPVITDMFRMHARMAEVSANE